MKTIPLNFLRAVKWTLALLFVVTSTMIAQTPTPTPTPPPPAQALNLSTRMRVETGDRVGIGGFIITGSAPKHVLIRAIGPSLAGFGVPNALADPVLELHGPGAFGTITNNNWRDTQEAAITATGIPPTNNLESAIDATLAPGAYTAIVSGNGNTSGVALVEAYDLNPTVDSKLANISTRAFCGEGDDLVIAGFILGNGAGDAGVIIHGLGPSLTAAGVPTVLPNPTLELRNSEGTLLISNDDWQEDPSQVAQINAVGLAPGNNSESAISAIASPGLYTALLKNRNPFAGIGVIAFYFYDLETVYPPNCFFAFTCGSDEGRPCRRGTFGAWGFCRSSTDVCLCQ